MNYNDRMKDMVVQEALNIYDNNDVTMEEAMDIALESQDQRAEVIDMAMDIFENTDATMEEAMGVALENRLRPTPTHEREYSDYISPIDKTYMQGLFKWIDDYNSMPDCPTRDKLGRKIAKLISIPRVRDALMANGDYNTIPPEIKQASRERKYKRALKRDTALRQAWATKESFYDDIDDDSYDDYGDTYDYDYDDDDYYM